MKQKYIYITVGLIAVLAIVSFTPPADDPITKLTKQVNSLSGQVTNLRNSLANQKEEFNQKMTELEDDVLKKSLPIGTIVAYSKDASTIPSGWKLCDGSIVTDPSAYQFYNKKVPNLVSYFIRGKGQNETLLAKGGQDKIEGHSHSIPSHKHTVDGHNHSFTTNENRGGMRSANISYSYVSAAVHEYVTWSNYTTKTQYYDSYGEYDGNHKHWGTTDNSSWQYTSSAGSGYTGTSSSETNIPEYIALNYIIKIK